ncbi:MAG: adenylyl-sulfate kinase [Methylococcales bacterium]|nr:adenylyl-sulfate kinase [Methylococcales bacterium]
MSRVYFDKAQSRNDKQKIVCMSQPLTIWLTGLSGAGKSTLAYSLEQVFVTQQKACFVLDGDNLRQGLNANLGYSKQDRSENIRRTAEVARLMNDAGLIVIVALISPFLADRKVAKSIIGEQCFREVYVKTSLEVCEQRDVKGLYAKARQGDIADFTGISSAYDAPVNADLELDTAVISIEEAVHKLVNLVIHH